MVKDSIAILCRGNSLKFIDKIPDVDSMAHSKFKSYLEGYEVTL